MGWSQGLHFLRALVVLQWWLEEWLLLVGPECTKHIYILNSILRKKLLTNYFALRKHTGLFITTVVSVVEVQNLV